MRAGRLRHIVKAGQGDVLRDAQAQLVSQRVERSHGDRVVLAHKNIRQFVLWHGREPVADQSIGLLGVIAVGRDETGPPAHAALPQVQKGFLSGHMRRLRLRPCHEQGATVPARDDVLGDGRHGQRVVAADGHRVGIGRHPRKDHQLAQLTRAKRSGQIRIVETAADQHRGVDPPLAGTHERRAGVVLVQCVHQQGIPAAFAQDSGQPFHHHQLVRVRKVVHEQRDQVASVRGQARGKQVRRVAQSLRGQHHLGAGLCRNRRFLAKSAVYRPPRDARQVCDVVCGHAGLRFFTRHSCSSRSGLWCRGMPLHRISSTMVHYACTREQKILARACKTRHRPRNTTQERSCSISGY